MRADDHDFPVGVALDECAACLRALLLVHVEVAVHFRGGELDRMMHHVAGDDGFLAARANVHADVTRRVARRRLQPHLVGDCVIRLDEVVQIGLDDRVDRIDQVIEAVVAAGFAQVLPVVVFLPAEEIARLREGRHPLSVDLARVPPHVVEVQVRTHHGVDACGREPGRREVLEKRRLHVAEHGVFALPVVADAGVDHHALVA